MHQLGSTAAGRSTSSCRCPDAFSSSFHLPACLTDHPAAGPQGFERREALVKARAATCLSFLSLQEGDGQAATMYSDLATRADGYNARALVNKAAALVNADQLEAALGVLQQALKLEPLCEEALYDMGWVHWAAGMPAGMPARAAWLVKGTLHSRRLSLASAAAQLLASSASDATQRADVRAISCGNELPPAPAPSLHQTLPSHHRHTSLTHPPATGAMQAGAAAAR